MVGTLGAEVPCQEAHPGAARLRAAMPCRGRLHLRLLVFAQAVAVTCASCDNATTSDWLLYEDGASYINLADVDNWSRWSGGETVWRKLKLLQDPQVGDTNVTVSLVDGTFADTTGSELAPWGIASDCRGSPETADMQINLVNTPFTYQATIMEAEGYLAFGSVICSQNGQNCSASCGGLCGFCGLGLRHTTEAILAVVDQCAFDQGVQAWETTTSSTATRSTRTSTSSSSTTSSSITSSTTTYLGPTSTSTSMTFSSTTISTTTTSMTSSTTSSTTTTSTTTSTTTQVNGYYYYRFTPSQVAEEGGSCCCAHAVAELYFRNCGADVDVSSATASNPGGAWESNGPGNAIDQASETKWRDLNRQPLVIQWADLTPVDSYSYVTAADCSDNDPIAFELHGSQDGSYWEFLDSRVMTVAPPASTWRPAQTEWFTFKNCTPTTTATTLTQTLTTTSLTTATQSTTVSVTMTSTGTSTSTTESTTTVPEGEFVRLLTSGTCAVLQLFPILGPAECEEAARQLELPDLTAETTATANRPEGCYLYEGQSLWVGVNPASKGRGAETSGPAANQTRQPICSSMAASSRLATNVAQRGAGRSALVALMLCFTAVMQ
mmetsp:Transcript_45204/g.105393  ORF Transcript_45204/g.105393 Transcript_45204/m.105393 type:complete len:608 (+) Transcript_45204:20-1843(+)